MYERLLRPDRPRLAEAQKLVENVYDAREAWETLSARGFIPSEWVHRDDRSYLLEAPDGARRAYFPPSLRMALSLACDTANVRAAEEIGRATTKDLRNPQRTIWRCIRAETVNAFRDSLQRGLKDGQIVYPPELIQTGYVVDPYHTDALMMLVPEITLAQMGG